MAKITAVFLAFLLSVSHAMTEVAWAQEPTFNLAILRDPRITIQGNIPIDDFWATPEECLEAKTAAFYEPSIENPRPLAPNERIARHPTGGCFLMDLPDRDTEKVGRKDGKAWVKLPLGTLMVRNIDTGAYLRHEKCNNNIDDFEPFPPETITIREQTTVQEGIHCWDLNQNKLNDLNEDRNGDGRFDPLDCQGQDGLPGRNAETRVVTQNLTPQGEARAEARAEASSGRGLWWALGGIAVGGLLTWLATRNRGRGDIIINNPVPTPTPTPPPSGPGVTTGPATGGTGQTGTPGNGTGPSVTTGTSGPGSTAGGSGSRPPVCTTQPCPAR